MAEVDCRILGGQLSTSVVARRINFGDAASLRKRRPPAQHFDSFPPLLFAQSSITYSLAMSRRKLRNTAEETLNPPDSLAQGQMIARIVKANGKDLYTVKTPNTATLLVELEARFRGTIFVKRGGYVLIDTTSSDDRDNKIQGEIVNVVRDEKTWRKQPYWPVEFAKKVAPVDSDQEESTAGKMPPSDSEDEQG